MTELIRRLDPARFRVHVACFHREGAWLPRVVERAASVVEFPIHGFARPSTVWQLLNVRAVVPARTHCGGADMRFVREHLRLAWSGPGRGSGPHRQPPGAQPGQDRRADSSPAAGLSIGHEGRRQFAGGAADARAGGGRAIVHCGDSQRPRPRTRSLNESRPERSGPSSPSPTCGARRATRPCWPRRPCCVRTYPDLQFQIVGDGPRRRELEELSRARGLVRARRVPGTSGRRAGAARGGGRLRAALAVRGVSQRRDRGDGGRPSGRGQRRRRAARSDRQAAGPACSCRRAIPRRWRARCSRSSTIRPAPKRSDVPGEADVHQRYAFDRMIASFEDLYLSGLRARVSARPHEAEAARV